MDLPTFYPGHLLLAMPGIGDVNFDRAVIALCAHDGDGALGIDIGTPVDDLGIHELLRSFAIDPGGIPDTPVLRGGPVEPQRGFVLHSLDWQGDGVLAAGGSWGLSGSLGILQAIARGDGPRHYLIALGYAGWGAGQLEREMTGHGWFLGGDSLAGMFDLPISRRWEAAFAASGIDASHLVGQAGSA
ncbi:YqgE/AlgH family protein [Sphingobium aquiterrae]|uniref:YqgE/AlgH family protein n=1 Tax=Sphingobium aquiterrae TaxID=2038656 RepID=UPI003016D1A7